MNVNDDPMPSCLDRQIAKSEKDAFGHRHFADALRCLIEDLRHVPPYSIGLLGGWGTGKSSIKELYVADLLNDAHKAKDGKTRNDRVHTITFNAWRFGGREQDIKRALIRHVFLELGGSEERLQDVLFRQISEVHAEKRSLHQIIRDQARTGLLQFLPSLSFVLIFLAILYLSLEYFPVTGEWPQFGLITVVGAIFAHTLKLFKLEPVRPDRAINKISLPSTTVEEYEDLLLEQVKKFKMGQCKTRDQKSGKNCERLVVFVDDLDRLSAEEMVLGLDAVRTFMEIPDALLPDKLGLVFVISCDEARVADALAKGRGHGDLPGTVFTQADARRYLDRIFQFRLEIPPFPRIDMREYATQQLLSLPGISIDLAPKVVDSIVDRMIHIDVRDPRNALQIVNAFAQAWWIARKRENDDVGGDRPGGLHQGAVTGHPISLGALCAIKVNFPDFYSDLQRDPAMIHHLTDVLVRQRSLTELPVAAQQTIKETYVQVVEKEGSSEGTCEVRPKHRQLRQYLASLAGTRWPDSLQSLLVLSEDPITRKFGSRAQGIYEDLISGNTQGVLEGLGRNLDSSELKQSEARLLSNMMEQARLEREVRRVSASRVVASLVDRLPAGVSALLVGHLCRELADSVELRSQLGTERIRKVLSVADKADQQAIASRLVEDTLLDGDEVKLKLQTMQTPSLAEATQIVNEVIALVLPIRREYSLEHSADVKLLSWLTQRVIRIGGKSQQLPFKSLEEWMHSHDDHLLSSLGIRYAAALAAELESVSTSEIDVTKAVSRVRQLFYQHYAMGEDSRKALWRSVFRFVDLSSDEAAKMAWEFAVAHIQSLDTAQTNDFVLRLFTRISKAVETAAAGFDLVSAEEAAIRTLHERIADMTPPVIDAACANTKHWLQDSQMAKYSCQVLDELKATETEKVVAELEGWIPITFTYLALPCVSYYGTMYEAIGTKAQRRFRNELNDKVTNGPFGQDALVRCEAFLNGVPREAWKIDDIRSMLDGLIASLSERLTSEAEHLEKVLPIVVQLMPYATQARVGHTLHDVFARTKEQPSRYVWLHSAMKEHWPHKSEELSPYDPERIFRDACGFCKDRKKFVSAEFFESLLSMIETNIVAEELVPELIDAACAVWAVNWEFAIESLSRWVSLLSAGQVVGLIATIDWENQEQVIGLTKVWSRSAKRMSLQERKQVLLLILGEGAQGPEGLPDRALQLWCECLEAELEPVMEAALLTEEIGDSHRLRLWQLSEDMQELLSSSYFLQTIPRMFRLTLGELTEKAIFEASEMVYEHLATADNRAILANQLMEGFPRADSISRKAGLARLAKRLSGDACLERVPSQNITREDVDILRNHFGDSRGVRKLSKNVEAIPKPNAC